MNIEPGSHAPQFWRRPLFVALMLVLMAAAIAGCLAAMRVPQDSPASGSESAPVLTATSQTGMRVSPQSRPPELALVGTVEASDTVSVTAPFDGVILEKKFAFDSAIEEGQDMLSLDTTELSERLQEAKVAMLKSRKAVQELATWEQGAEMARAQRSLTQAQQQVDQGVRKVQEAETLLKKGIIPRSERDGLAEQLENYQTQLTAAASDLRATREKASRGNRQIAGLEYEQAKAKYQDLARGIELRRIVAPRSGIVSRAPASSGQAPASLDIGSRVTEGQLLFSIARTDSLQVSAKVDEADVVDLVPGTPVAISVESQDMPPLQGRLASVSAQASQAGGGVRSAVFDIRIALPPLDEWQRRRLRIGMSCNVIIETSQGVHRRPNSPALSANGQGPRGH